MSIDWGKTRSGLYMSRRSLLKAGALASAAALTPSLLTRSAAAAATKGGHFRMATIGASANDSLDPRTYVASFPTFAGYFWGNMLFRVDDKMQLVPELAESWENTPDAKSWVVKLRKGVQFHNGKTLTSADVIYTINRHTAKESASGLRPILAQIAEMKATQPDEIRFELKAGNADWLYLMSDYHLQIQPEGEPTDKGIGTGAYMVENFEPGIRLRMKRNENYWRDGAPNFDTIELIGINDSTARVSALQTGEVDMATHLPPKIAPLLAGGGFRIHRANSTTFSEFVGHSKDAPFDNNDLRLALKYAIDRQEMLDKVFFKSGAIGNDHPIPGFFRFHAAELPQRAYDLDKAKFHYKKSGHSGPLPALAVGESIFQGAAEASELFQQQAKRAGIDLPLQRVPMDGFWANVWNQRPFFVSSWFGRPTEDQMLTAAFHSESGFNETQTKNPKLDQLLLLGRSETDIAKRKQHYFDIQQIVWEEGSSIVPQFQELITGTSAKIEGFTPSPLGDGKFIETVYAAA